MLEGKKGQNFEFTKKIDFNYQKKNYLPKKLLFGNLDKKSKWSTKPVYKDRIYKNPYIIRFG